MKGHFYEDHASIRVQEMAKIKGNKLELSKTKLELAIIRPGSLSENRIDESRFKGRDALPTERPTAETKLYPINSEMRTIIG